MSLQGHTIHSLDTTSQKPWSGASKLRAPWPQTSALAQHGVSQSLSFQATSDPHLEQFWHAPQSQARNHRNTELGSFLPHFGALPPKSPSSEQCGEWMQGCLRSALQILTARVRHSWRSSNDPSAIFLATGPIGSSTLTFFKQTLCEELLGPTFL